MDKRQAVEFLEYLRQDRNLERTIYRDALNMAIDALKAQLFSEGTTKDATSDTISRQAAIDIERNATVDTNPSHFEAHQKFTQFMDDAEISSFGRWQWSNGFNTALTAVGIDLKKLPPAQPEVLVCGNGELVAKPEPTDIDAREAVYNLAEKIGIHQLYALTVELRGEPIQPEPAIPLSWIENEIKWLKSLDNTFSEITALQITAMVNKWREEQNERTD